jgi:hypothetical protein
MRLGSLKGTGDSQFRNHFPGALVAQWRREAHWQGGDRK